MNFVLAVGHDTARHSLLRAINLMGANADTRPQHDMRSSQLPPPPISPPFSCNPTNPRHIHRQPQKNERRQALDRPPPRRQGGGTRLVCEEIREAIADYLDIGFKDLSTRYLRAEETLVKAKRACALLGNASVLDQAYAHDYKGKLEQELGRIGDALASFREAQQLYTLALGERGVSTGDRTAWALIEVTFHVGRLLESANQLAESEKCFIEILSSPLQANTSRISCLDRLAHIHNRRKEWEKGSKCCAEALKLLEVTVYGNDEDTLKFRVGLLIKMGNALEGLGEWTSARRYDRQAWTLWAHSEGKLVDREIMSALHREGLDLLSQGKPFDAATRMANAQNYYLGVLNDRGINRMVLYQLRPAMATLKVWGEACSLTLTEDVRAFMKMVHGKDQEDPIEHIGKVLADVAETEAIIEAYEEAVLEETRREAREARAAAARGAATTAEGETNPVASTAKSKAAKRKQQKRKAAEEAGGRGGSSCCSGSGGRSERSCSRRRVHHN